MITANMPSSLVPYQYEIVENQSYCRERISSYENSSGFYSLPEINVGDTRYKFISSVDILVNYEPNEKKWECRNYSRKFDYLGVSSESREMAIENFKLQIHIHFQQLYSKRPFEMTEKEYGEWIKLANTIDLLYYKTTTPIKIKEVGCVSFGKVSYPYRIKWLTDENYFIDPLKVPAELMRYSTGQWIEAIVERDPVNHQIIRIISVQKIRFHVPKPGEAKKYWNDIERIKLDKQSG